VSLAQANKQAAATKMGLPGWFANLIDIDVQEQGPSTANISTMDSQPASSPSNASIVVENASEDTPVLLYAFPVLAVPPGITLDEATFNVDMSIDLSDKLLEDDDFSQDVVLVYAHPAIQYPPGFVLKRQEMYPQTEEEQALPFTPAKGVETRALPSAPYETPVILHGYNNYTSIQQPVSRRSYPWKRTI
jgi:hypothetical protein